MTAQRRITDEALVCFVLWCRQNPESVATNPEVARKVLAAYTKVRPTAALSGGSDRT